MDLQKFGVKLFFNTNGSYSSKDFVPIFHNWIQNKAIDDHLLIDVADYSHIPDGPGVMLIAHEGNFSLDQESQQPGIMYMRKTEIAGSFKERFNMVLSTVVKAANRLNENNISKQADFTPNLFNLVNPPKAGRLMTNPAPTISFSPKFSISSKAAIIVPPVAKRSSMINSLL